MSRHSRRIPAARRRAWPCPGPLALAIAAAWAAFPADAPRAAEDALYAAFNPAFLRGPDGRPLDVTRYEHGNPVTPGSYRVDVYVNQTWTGRQELRVRGGEGDAPPSYCFKRSQLPALGLDSARLPDAKATARALEDADCVDVVRLVPGARADFVQGDLRLDLSIPQAYLGRVSRGYVDPRDWDRGVTAAFVDYNANAYRTEAGGTQDQYYAGLNAGLNLGDWRLRHNGSYSQSQGDRQKSTRHYDAISSYAQRDVTALKSQLTLGEYFTPADLFDSVPYSGVQLASDDRMLPDSQRGFAPAIRGTAETNAKVTVRQGGNVLYETSVAPGPFVIDDLYNSGYAGDLEVTVTEADGRVRQFTVPFASVAQLLRPGVSRYSVTAGKYRDDRLDDTPNFVQGTYQRGISNLWTGYTGSIVAENYLALQGGLALSTPVGAFAFDVTQSHASGLKAGDQGGSASGQSFRLSYSKLLESTRTNFAVAAYRFSSDGYLNFADFAYARSPEDANYIAWRQRNRFQVNLSQPLGERLGSLYLSGSAQNYWNTGKGSDMSYQAGYSNSFSWGSLSLSANRTRALSGETDTQYMLNLSLPLGRFSHAPYLNSTTTRNSNGDINSQLSVAGSLGDYNQFSYGVYGSRSRIDGQSSNTGGANVQYRAPQTNLSASYSEGEGYHQYGLGLTGSVVAHPGGINFSQAQGETRAVIEARGAAGAALVNSSGGAVGGNGYGVVSSLMPYRENQVALDPKGLPDDVELQTTAQNVAPRYGAVVMLKYPTVSGQPLLLRLLDEQGNNLPVGAEVLDAKGNSLTLVGQGSRVFLRLRDTSGELQVRWGEGPQRQCRARYQVPAAAGDGKPFQQAEAVCVRPSAGGELAAR
ncbi:MULTISPECIES: fimbria/pilus outer membrane usher protein [unclassified Pseudomonas]|uniref:fimbria/pilus outer membrane usher protein n=1 Tax=unclassified Pseudomonas TaxID=196821 RepID=UPI0004D41C2C|nr:MULTISPECIES: fimbria/pilus outer membrane usher protein [unclassified Pseudomonas]KES21453.1 pilus assembly protein PapC [Pseudomonas sp. AAC]